MSQEKKDEEQTEFWKTQKWLWDHSSDHIDPLAEVEDTKLILSPDAPEDQRAQVMKQMYDRVMARIAERSKPAPEPEPTPGKEDKCDHGVTFDEEAARAILDGWQPKNNVEFVMGNPSSSQIRKRWPRLCGVCPKGCGYNGIAYASSMHYIMGDW